ncbi:hypothetical protein GA0070607_5549 [Micromonospora coriariae]|uniref:Acetyltransferase (GNAT) domain-containing protein n=1 Tax=Micromonospora coriariae TaxID=285665 RepID=A0A1C4XNM4_9ACTN|nr:hypothetical protein [Micromonospora coriariae]SCF10120.1 hypothetical protein GA0070607_5549 [Micromonospora coriariae]
MPKDVREAAARNNAEWCDVVCGSHGLAGRTDADAWSVPRRSPTWYPDAVTLRPGVDADALLARIDAGPGASVKDSFAELDLSRYGFRVLFDAQWIHRPALDPPAGAPLTPVTTPAELAAWAAAHGGGPLFRPALLADPRVRVLARYDDRRKILGGAVVSGDSGYGVSNLFAHTVDPREIWHGVLATMPRVPLVGYESGPDLAPALAVGFTQQGPLRIWLHDQPRAVSRGGSGLRGSGGERRRLRSP